MTVSLAYAAPAASGVTVGTPAPQGAGIAVAERAALAVTTLGKTFGNDGGAVFANISFAVPRGQSVAIIGANGAGKSTLLRCCLRLVEPDAGRVHVDGRLITGLSGRPLREARSRVGFIFQKHNLVPRLSVLSNVLHGGMAQRRSLRLWHQAVARPEDRRRALDCLDRVGLADLAGRRADHLSGGQSQRVAIARALMQDPITLFADEPVASLDPHAGEDVMETFAGLVRDHGLTLIFVSHQLRHALTYSDRILGLRGGQLSLDSPAAEQTETSLRDLYA